MPTIEVINTKIREIGADVNFMVKSDINSLPNILAPDETFENILQGIYNDRNGILVFTDRRLLFVHKKLIGGVTVEDFPLTKISSIQYSTGLLQGEVKIHTAGNNAIIKQVSKSKVMAFCEAVKSKIPQ